MATKKGYILFASVALLWLLASCQGGRNRALFVRLRQWDGLLEAHPGAVKDSLETLNPEELSPSNRAYHGLLKTVAAHKTYTRFHSDSLINSVQTYFDRHERGSENHIRALTYLSVVRYRQGITDSTVFSPLKEAERLYLLLKRKNASLGTGYGIYYYLGELFSNKGKYDLAENCFGRALQLTKQKNDPRHIFDVYQALYRNEMMRQNFPKGKEYLDSAALYTCDSADVLYRFYSAQATYSVTQGDFAKRLEYTQKRLALLPYLKEEPFLSRFYYSLSDAYAANRQPDSAMLYALRAVTHITDSTCKLNYLLYENVADIAEGQNNLALALEYRKKAFDAYEKSVDARLNTRILELEKRYSLAEVENRMLRTEKRSRIWFIGLMGALFLLMLFGLYVLKQRTIAGLKERETKEELLRLQDEKKQMERQAARQRKMMEISAQFLSEYAALQKQAREMTNRIRAKENKLGDDYERMLKEGQERFNRLAHRLFTEEEFKKRFSIYRDLEVFSQSDRLFLIMLAANAPTAQIAAMLNTTTNNLKTRKSYLKNKIEKNATPQNNFGRLLPLFSAKRPE